MKHWISAVQRESVLTYKILTVFIKTSLIREINVGCFSFPDDDDSKSQDKIDEGERLKHTKPLTFNFQHKPP